MNQLNPDKPLVIAGDYNIDHLNDNDPMSKPDRRQMRDLLDQFTDHAQLTQINFKPIWFRSVLKSFLDLFYINIPNQVDGIETIPDHCVVKCQIHANIIQI